MYRLLSVKTELAITSTVQVKTNNIKIIHGGTFTVIPCVGLLSKIDTTPDTLKVKWDRITQISLRVTHTKHRKKNARKNTHRALLQTQASSPVCLPPPPPLHRPADP